jgi:hypothetical protein
VEFKTSSYRSGFIGLAVAGGLTVLAFGLGSLIVSLGGVSVHRPLPLLVLGLGAALLLNLVVLVLVLYWSIAALRLRYRLNRNGLVIWWGASRLIVPMERIERMTTGDKFVSQGNESSGWRGLQGMSWAGLRAGRARLADDMPARVFTTLPLIKSTVVLTPDRAYVVSPRAPDTFVEAWRVRCPLGPTQYWREEERRAWFVDLPIWRDRIAWTLIGLGLLANLALHIYLSFVYERLPAMLSFHFDALGQADRIASRIQILRLPQVALLVLVLDLGLGFALYRRWRVASYLIWGGGLALQLFVWGAIFTIIG